MSKYDPLTTFLESKRGRELKMSFEEIEAVIGRPLPAKSKTLRAWWSNNPSNNVLTRAWLAAGYRSAQVDIVNERLTFVPNADAGGFGEMKQQGFKEFSAEVARPETGGDKTPYRHPAWGAMKGMITILPDVDLTAPAYDDWKKLYGEDK